MRTYVFDTEPLIAYLYDEPGSGTVLELLKRVHEESAAGELSHATAAEIIYKLARLETGDPNRYEPGKAELEAGADDFYMLQGFGLSVETPSWRTVARCKAPGGLSLGDAYAAALAFEREATLVVGSDTDFDALPVDVDLHRIGEGRSERSGG